MSSITSTSSAVPLPVGGAARLGPRAAERIRATVARSPWARARGLLFRPAPGPGEGMLFPRCGSVHTWLMSYPIDVVYLDNASVVTKVAPAVPPWRFSSGARGSRHTLELRAGEAARLGLRPGTRLEFDEGGDGAEETR